MVLTFFSLIHKFLLKMSHPNKGDVIMKEAGKKVRKLTEVVNEQQQKMKIEKDVPCEYVDSTSILYTGTYLQFVNLNATGLATMIGGVRIQLQDIAKVLQYLSKNKSIILQ